MFNPEQVQAVKAARLVMQEHMVKLRHLEQEEIPAGEADLAKAESAYRDAAAAAVGNRAARSKVLEAEAARDEARRRLDGLRRAAEVGKGEGQRLGDAYGTAIHNAKLAEAKRLMAEAQAKFREIAARWNGFAAAVRELVLIKKALSELGDEGGMQLVAVAQELDRAASGRFCLETMAGWELPQDKQVDTP